MVDAELKQQVHQQIQAKVKPLADGAFKRMAGAVPELQAAIKKVERALREGASSDLLQTYRRELVIRMRAVNEARKWAVDALAALAEATADDEAFEAGAAEIEALQARLAKARDLLADQVVKGKKVEDRAASAAEANDRSEASAHREWDLLVTGFERSTSLFEALLKDMRGWKKDAEAAVKARDRALLQNLQETLANVALDEAALQGKALMRRTNEFMSTYELDGFSRDFLEEMAHDRATTVDAYDKHVQALQQEARRIQEAVQRLAIDAPNAVKATAELGFKANFITRVGAALALDESRWPRELEAIARQAGDKTSSGRQLVDKLRRAKLL